jgi:hypothetical protein
MRNQLARRVRGRATLGATVIGVAVLASACFSGSPPAPPAFSLTPATHSFGPVTHGLAPSATFTVTNSGGPATVFYTFAPTGLLGEDGFFVNPFVSTCVFQVLGQGQSCTIVVAVNPGALPGHTYGGQIELGGSTPMASFTVDVQ